MKIYTRSNAETRERKRILDEAGVALTGREKDAFSPPFGFFGGVGLTVTHQLYTFPVSVCLLQHH